MYACLMGAPHSWADALLGLPCKQARQRRPTCLLAEQVQVAICLCPLGCRRHHARQVAHSAAAAAGAIPASATAAAILDMPPTAARRQRRRGQRVSKQVQRLLLLARGAAAAAAGVAGRGGLSCPGDIKAVGMVSMVCCHHLNQKEPAISASHHHRLPGQLEAAYRVATWLPPDCSTRGRPC